MHEDCDDGDGDDDEEDEGSGEEGILIVDDDGEANGAKACECDGQRPGWSK